MAVGGGVARLLAVGRDAGLIAQRNLRRLFKSFQVFTFSLVQPVFQLVLFAVILGSLASFHGEISYREYVVPAVILQTLVFVAATSGIAVAFDMAAGMVERLRALPITRSAFIVGRLMSDGVRLALVAVALTLAGVAMGFRFHYGWLGAIGMVVTVWAFGVMVDGIAILMAVRVKNLETVSNVLMISIMPLVFCSSAYVPVHRLPGWLQPVATMNPTSAFVDLARGLGIGPKVAVVGAPAMGVLAAVCAAWFVTVVGLSTFASVRGYTAPARAPRRQRQAAVARFVGS